MHKRLIFSRRLVALVGAAGLVVSSVLPMIVNTAQVSAAAQLTLRQISISSSKVSETDVTYSPSFKVTTGSAIQGIVVDFCDATAGQGPLIGTVCTAPTGLNTNKATLALANQVGITGFTIDTVNSTANKVVLTNGSGGVVAANTTVSFDLGTSAANDGFTNPSGLGTYYARILTYSTPAGATGYDSSTTGANNPGTFIDDGGVALSTANQLSTTARVQEQLEFCVAATDTTVNSDATAPVNCSDAKMTTSTSVDLGVVDTSTPVPGTSNASPVPSSNGGNGRNGGFLIRTNAVNGAIVSYKAEQDSSTGTDKGTLKVSTANCVSNVSVTDQCFNPAGATKTVFNTAGEKFGMILPTTQVYRPTGSTTTNLTPFGQYSGTGAAADGFTWEDDGNVHEIASTSGTVADYEFATMVFAARAAATTPTGTYTVTSTYIATSTF